MQSKPKVTRKHHWMLLVIPFTHYSQFFPTTFISGTKMYGAQKVLKIH